MRRMDIGQAHVMLPALLLSSVFPAPRRVHREMPLLAVPSTLLFGAGAYGTHWWTTLRFFEETDDAYLAADAVAVSPASVARCRRCWRLTTSACRPGSCSPDWTMRDYRMAQRVAVADLQSAGADVANFKETQLAHMSAGEAVSMRTDMLPGVELRGRIDSPAPGSGAQFALLPPENAIGNFTKIVQRVPVRVTISTAGLPPDVLARLRPGLSVVASVDTRTQPPGPVRTLALD